MRMSCRAAGAGLELSFESKGSRGGLSTRRRSAGEASQPLGGRSAEPETDVLFCDLDALLASPVPERKRVATPEPEPVVPDAADEIDLVRLLSGDHPTVGDGTGGRPGLSAPGPPPQAPHHLYALLAVMLGVVVGLTTALLLLIVTRDAGAPRAAEPARPIAVELFQLHSDADPES